VRKTFFSKQKGRPAGPSLLYYDGQCSLCVTLAHWLGRLDLLRTLELRSTLDTPARQAGLDQIHLDRAAWLVTPAGVTYQGFYAFRRLALRLPPLWPIVPLLWLPGVSFWGARLYRWVADHRATISGCRASENGMKSISPPL
jgi:predicted DCC family thiol-disulfide oxidoreductase YuxK